MRAAAQSVRLTLSVDFCLGMRNPAQQASSSAIQYDPTQPAPTPHTPIHTQGIRISPDCDLSPSAVAAAAAAGFGARAGLGAGVGARMGTASGAGDAKRVPRGGRGQGQRRPRAKAQQSSDDDEEEEEEETEAAEEESAESEEEEESEEEGARRRGGKRAKHAAGQVSKRRRAPWCWMCWCEGCNRLLAYHS